MFLDDVHLATSAGKTSLWGKLSLLLTQAAELDSAVIYLALYFRFNKKQLGEL